MDTNNSELGTIVLGDNTECPYCHHKLKVKVSRKKKSSDGVYMSVLQVVEGFQVIRHILCCRDSYKRVLTRIYLPIFIIHFRKLFRNGLG